MELLEQIEDICPVLRVKSLEENIAFFGETLGMAVLKQSKKTVELSGHGEKKAHIYLLQSDEADGFRVPAEPRRHLLTVLKINQDELVQLLRRRPDLATKIYHSEAGYAFEVRSPDGYQITLSSGEGPNMRELSHEQFLQQTENGAFIGLSDLKIVSIMVNSTALDNFYAKTNLSLYIHTVPVGGDDVAAMDTWDIAGVQIRLRPEVKVEDLTIDLSGREYVLDDKTHSLAVKGPDNFGIEFKN